MNNYGYKSMEELQGAVKRHEIIRSSVIVVLGALLLGVVVLVIG